MYFVFTADSNVITFFFPVGIPSFTPHAGHGGFTPHIKKPRCDTTGWTAWMSSSTPTESNRSDVETKDSLRRKYTFCSDSQQTSIQCRKVGSQETGRFTEQTVTCNLKDGLQCKGDEQSGDKKCFDYEVRFSCNCCKYIIIHGRWHELNGVCQDFIIECHKIKTWQILCSLQLYKLDFFREGRVGGLFSFWICMHTLKCTHVRNTIHNTEFSFS